MELVQSIFIESKARQILNIPITSSYKLDKLIWKGIAQ